MPFFKNPIDYSNPKFAELANYYRMDEAECVNRLIKLLSRSEEYKQHTQTLAKELIVNVRKRSSEKGGLEAFMLHYDLSTEEGIMLMCLAEALLRVPDKETEDLLIRDKLTGANWSEHVGVSESSFVNMATWGLALTGKVLRVDHHQGYFKKLWKDLVRRSGEPIIRQAVREAIKIMSQQFVLGRSIEEAQQRSKELSDMGYTYSFDMLGEVARTQADADKYYQAYLDAIDAIGKAVHSDNLFHGPSISVKLSALYPRYEFAQQESAIPLLSKRLLELAQHAKAAGIALTVDAEEADRLEMSLMIFANVFVADEFADWNGLGLAVQAYQKRAYPLIDWLSELAEQHNKRIPMRLVKGAYWDSEIKLSQVEGFSGYPVFTRKVSTDISYLACAKLMLSHQKTIYPQFATHNAYSVAAIISRMEGKHADFDFEFQNLQGMGKELHDQIVAKDGMNIPCRIYAPVGSHEDLLPYLVRRLLENGANSSFVNQIADPNTPVEKLITDPIHVLRSYEQIANSRIPLPKDIYGDSRENSRGLDVSNHVLLSEIEKSIADAYQKQWQASPFNRKIASSDTVQDVLSPIDHKLVVGKLVEANEQDVETALQSAEGAFDAWSGRAVTERAELLNKVADLLEAHRGELMALAIREAGKTLANAVNEVREAVDFCRYYANMASDMMQPKELPGPTGEQNLLLMHGRGPFVCISPWNFPVAIFTGQIMAALVTGNTVIAKPAEQTPLVAARVVELCYQAGIPKEVLQLLPGRGEVVGAKLIADARVAGVMFTGSTDTAKAIQRGLAQDPQRAIIPFIAETGGINALIADSTALPEQLVADVVASAFDSAGQRCSALRLLLVQDDIADRVIEMLRGAMQELTVGDPQFLATDIGPVIDRDAQAMLNAHAQSMIQKAKLIYQVDLSADAGKGTFVAPQAFELSDISALNKEVFGPILHVVRYSANQLDKMIDQINALGYGLTFGVQTRIEDKAEYIASRIKVGNVYVNRNVIGAVVGVQPFGGSRLSGTGPKAGGPHYLARLCEEKTISINTTAAGGNASLMALDDE